MLASLIVRAFQILAGAVVLGLSIKAIQWQGYGSVPATTGFSAFAGAWGLLTALVGIAAVFVDAIPNLIMAGADAVASIFLLAGGIAFAIGLRGIRCDDPHSPWTNGNKLINGGCHHVKGQSTPECHFYPYDQLKGRCKSAEADAAFLFIGFLASVAAAALCFIASRRGGGRHSAV